MIMPGGQRVGSVAHARKMNDGILAADTEGVDGHVTALHFLGLNEDDFFNGAEFREEFLGECGSRCAACACVRASVRACVRACVRAR